MKLFKEGIRWAFYAAYRCLPKADYAVVYGWPDFEDNALALQQALAGTRLQQIILFVEGRYRKPPFALAAKVKVVRKDSLAGMFYFLFARYLFFTHRCFLRHFPANVVAVNVWHGMPVKRIGWMLEDNQGITAMHAVATSMFWKPIMRQAMRPFGRILVAGLPRNDRLMRVPADLWQRLEAPAAASCSKVVMWLPTYRRSTVGEIRTDGRETGSVLGLEGISPEQLNELLRSHNAFAFIKPHPMAPPCPCRQLSHLRIIDDHELRQRGVSLYGLLGACQVLVTDISSVYIDYLILDRPIIHSFPDMDEYRSSRGFSIDPVSDYFAGPCATDASTLLGHLAEVLEGGDPGAAKRAKLRALFHDHHDDRASERILREIGLLP